jgi:hypothetical protein
MAVTYRFPVLVWQDHEGWFTARVAEGDAPAGIGGTVALAVTQVQDYLEWWYRENPWAADGVRIGTLPMFVMQFYYHEADALKGLVAHYVQQRLEGLTPQALSRYLPPASVSLDEVVIAVRHRERSGQDDPAITFLKAVAEPLGEPGVRRHFSRPWERDREVADLIGRLGKDKANVVLVAEAGAGKTTVLVETVRQLEQSRPGD